MHLYLLTRGITYDIERFVNDMAGKHLPKTWKNNVSDVNEPIKNGVVNIAMRPVQFWEVIFPEESLNTVLTSLWPDRTKTEGHYGNMATMKHQKYLWMLRKALGSSVEPLPQEFEKTNKVMPIWRHNVELLGVGLKKDARINGVEML